MKKTFFAAILIFSAVCSFAGDSFARGEELFMRNNPQEASVFFESAIIENPDNIKAFLYLGIAYEQIDRLDEAVAVYRQIIGRAGDLTANIANNLGNIYFRKGIFSEAENFYTRAIEADRLLAPAWLGRANARVGRGALREALNDYDQFLVLEPRSRQRGEIERLTSLVRAEFAAAERQRLVAEEIARAEEERRRVAAEEAARMEAERVETERRRLAEEAVRLEAERVRLVEEAERQRLIAEEDARLAVERRRLAEEAAVAEAERRRLAAEEAARVEAERQRLAAEEAARVEAERQRLAEAAAAAEAERRRVAAEEAARVAAERQRRTEELARLEAERRQRLLDEVSASLQGAAGSSQGLSAGAEGIEGWEGEFELD